MGKHKPQSMPAAVRLAHEVLAQIASEVDATRLEELRKKLPAYAMRAEKAGQEVTVASLRAAALDVRADFMAAAGDGAGGGKLTLADYARISAAIKIERDNPWMAVFENGDADEYMRLRTARVEKPYNRETWDVMLRALAARPDPLPVLELLLADQYSADVVKHEEPHHPRQILVRHIDRAMENPFLENYISTNQYFHQFLTNQGYFEVIEKIFPPEHLERVPDILFSCLAGALKQGRRDVARAKLAQYPTLADHPKLAYFAVQAGDRELLKQCLDRVQDEGARRHLLRDLFAFAMAELKTDVLEVILEHGAAQDDLGLQSWMLKANELRHAHIEMMGRLHEKGLWRIGNQTLFGQLHAQMRLRGSRASLQMLEQAALREGLAMPQDLKGAYYSSAAFKAPESEGQAAEAEIIAWQLNALRAALHDKQSSAVVVYLAIDLLGYYSRQINNPAEALQNDAENRLRALCVHKDSPYGMAGALARRAQASYNDTMGVGMDDLKNLVHLYSAVDEILADAPAGEARELARILCEQSYKRLAEPSITVVAGASNIGMADLQSLLDMAGGRKGDVLEGGLKNLMAKGAWRQINAIIDHGFLDDLPDVLTRIKAVPNAEKSMQGARAWNRIMPDMNVEIPLLWQPLRHIRPALLRGVMDLMRDTGHNESTLLRRAYNLCAVFRSEDRIMRYVERWGDKYKNQRHILASLAEAIAMPERDSAIDPGAWGDALLQYGPEMGAYMKYADRIAAPQGSLVQMRENIAQYHYKRGVENPALAGFCYKYSISDKAFDRALELMSAQAARATPMQRKIPDFDIAGDDFGMPGARFYRMKDDDYRGLFLGKLVDCCQHLDHAAWVAEHGFMSEEGGFYVIETEQGEILGQTWAWRGTGGQLVFDSLETLGKNKTEGMRVSRAQWSALLDRVREQLAAAPGDITALTVGTDGNRCPLLNYDVPNGPPVPFEKAKAPAKPRDHKGYSDSAEQYLLWAAEGYKDEPVPEPAEPRVLDAWVLPPQRQAQPQPQPPRAAAPPGLWDRPPPQMLMAALGPGALREAFRDPHQGWLDDGGPDFADFPMRGIRRGPPRPR